MSLKKASLKIYGFVAIAVSLLGILTVADDLRHTGELIGVFAILLSGLILLASGYYGNRIKILDIEYIAFGLLAGIPIGGIVLDNMIAGEILGLLAGTAAAVYSGRKKNGQ